MQPKVTLFSLIFVMIFGFIQAQEATDLISVRAKGKGKNFKILPETATLLTNRAAYDNQPRFINDQQLVFSASDEKGNFDIIAYNFQSSKFTNLSKTADRGEFSPKITDCGQYISAVVIEPSGQQRIWLYPVNFEEPELLYDDIDSVAYYEWINNKAAIMQLGNPNQLIYVHGRDHHQRLTSNPGRCLIRRPGTVELTYMSLDTEEMREEGKQYEMLTFEPEQGTIQPLGKSLGGSQDFVWIDKNRLLMARGNELFMRHRRKETWEFLGKIKLNTHQSISRMAFSEELNTLVLVMNRNKPNPTQ